MEEDCYEGQPSPPREVPGVSTSPRAVGASCTPGWDRDGRDGKLEAWDSPCLVTGTPWRPALRFWGGQAWLGGGDCPGQPLQVMKRDAGGAWRTGRRTHHSPAAARGWEEVLGTTSGDRSNTALPAELAHLGSTGQLVGAVWQKRNLPQPQ